MPDTVKKTLAAAVQTTLERGLGYYPEPLRNAQGVEATTVEVHRISDLETQLRVSFPDSMSRYFTVRVSEAM